MSEARAVVSRRSVSATARSFEGSPDGRWLAFAQSATAGSPGVFVSSLDGGGRRLVARRGDQPTWASDGRRLAFVRDGAIWVIGTNGRGLHRLSAGPRDFSPEWFPGGRVIAFKRDRRLGRGSPCSDLYVVRASGGVARRIFDPARICGVIESLDWSPDARRLVVSVGDATIDPEAPVGGGRLGVVVIRSDGKGRRNLTDRSSSAVWSPDGQHIACFGGGVDCGMPKPGPLSIPLCVRRHDGSGLRLVSEGGDQLWDWLVRRR